MPGEPLPTLGELIRADQHAPGVRRAGRPRRAAPGTSRPTSGSRRPRFYFKRVDDFTCQPNRGAATAPLLLVNHWVSEGGSADPTGAAAGEPAVHVSRPLQQCLQQRGRVPNVVAVDFAGQGDLVSTARKLNDELLDLLKRVRKTIEQQTASTAPTTTPTSVAPGGRAPPTSVAATPPFTAPQIKALTGGDPVAFCAELGDFRKLLNGWGLAAASEPRSRLGRPIWPSPPPSSVTFPPTCPLRPSNWRRVAVPCWRARRRPWRP